MRIAAISDIHGNLLALEAVLADIAQRGADVTVNLGDILSGPLQPAATADRLMPLDMPTIAGNHERQVLTHALERMGESDRYAYDHISELHRAWLHSLPSTLRLAPDVLLVHGTPSTDLVYWLESVDADGQRPASYAEVVERAGDVQASLILCGHTHVPRSVLLDDGRLIVNPGSVGLQAYEDVHPHPHRAENGTPHARYAMLERRGSAWLIEQIAVPYDWHAASAMAAANGRPDWAHALATGRMPA
ncbi:metallophosphoesterase family protein [Massilia sp. SM-13]|uniref:metallophosphoesterase family protein n=1 Tax=Pseudoduganella rhizocola TaxID=3382643 RepID=UPI0038B41DF6